MINQIHFGDNRNIIAQLPDKSIDCFIEDMPFNTTCADFEYEVDLAEYWEIRKRIAKPGAVFVLFAGTGLFTAKIMMFNPKLFKYELAWVKRIKTGMLTIKHRPLREFEKLYVFQDEPEYENLCVFSGAKSTYNPQMGKGKPYAKSRDSGTTRVYKAHSSWHNENKGIRHPTTLLYFAHDKSRSNRNESHPTQKPTNLLRYLVLTYSNEGDTIFDGFSGSGSLAEACIREKRNFICCEWNEDYYNLSQKRIEKVKIELETQQNLFENGKTKP